MMAHEGRDAVAVRVIPFRPQPCEGDLISPTKLDSLYPNLPPKSSQFSTCRPTFFVGTVARRGLMLQLFDDKPRDYAEPSPGGQCRAAPSGHPRPALGSA